MSGFSRILQKGSYYSHTLLGVKSNIGGLVGRKRKKNKTKKLLLKGETIKVSFKML